MILFDRLKGIETEVSDIQPNRYRVQQATRMNQHTDLQSEDIIHSDGKKSCQLGNSVVNIHTDKVSATQSLFEDAILTIDRITDQNITNKTSPLLPASLVGEDMKLSSLESQLKLTIEAGHLHHISQRPRLELKYEELVTEVSRAKRTTNATLKHLVSHSECWQRRTLTGVIPRKVLARHSEDDHLLYENKVYASLLDALERHLRWRLQRVLKLTESIQDSLDFQNSESVDYRLNKTICSLWGEVFDANSIQNQLKANKQLLSELKFLLRQLSVLKQRGLYTLIPQSARVSGQVYLTNILKHDAHYRHLPLMWDSLKLETKKALKPQEIFSRNKELHLAYSNYVGLVIQRALEVKKLNGKWNAFSWGGVDITIVKVRGDWNLKSSDDSTLRLIPWLFYTSAESQTLAADNIICWPDTQDERQVNSVLFQNNLAVTPFDLYVVERMAEVIDTWLMKLLLKDYGEKILQIPNKAMNVLTQHLAFQQIDKQGVSCITSPVEKEDLIINTLQDTGTNKETISKIKKQLKNVIELGRCQVCKQKFTSFEPQKNVNAFGFFAKCKGCDLTSQFQNGTFQQRFTDGKTVDFSETGRLNLEIKI